MMKRSISPLIATIILIALTIAIGAIIVGWANSYVGQRTQCLNAQITIQNVYYNSSSSTLVIQAVNSGGTNILVSQLYVIVYDTLGNKYVCSSATGGDCSISSITSGGQSISQTWNVNTVATISVTISNQNLKNNIVNGYTEIQYGGCGVISTREMISAR